jgi:uncharacterized protein (TIGR01777 family)
MHSANLQGKKIALIGGSGFIGSKLIEALLTLGCEITIIDLLPPRTIHERVLFKKAKLAVEQLDPQFLSGYYGVVNLAGATIGRRWNKAYKKLIYDSRILTTKALVKNLATATIKPNVLVNASAAGYYGDGKDELLNERHGPGKDFLSHVCVDWEHAASEASTLGMRVVLIRTANVMGPGGLLASLRPLFTKGLGGYFGSGNQYMPWIHWTDIVDIYVFALVNEQLEGAYNVGAGNTISQKKIFKAFARSIHIPIVWRIPRFVARLILGEFADALIDSQNTSSQKIIDAGYVYRINDIESAL